MIELSPKFKQALATGVTTSLYPLVKIYKGVKIDENLNDATEVINLSIKDVTISAEAYKGLLLSFFVIQIINLVVIRINNSQT